MCFTLGPGQVYVLFLMILTLAQLSPRYIRLNLQYLQGVFIAIISII